MQKKKSLGQHFLKNPYYLGLVADAADIKQGETIIEIGPGEGTLTKVLLERGAKVVAVEKDRRLIPVLKEKFAAENCTVVEADALTYEPGDGPYKVVGNIPYYITGALFKKFLSAVHQPSTLVFLVQKEVAERIARDPKESILSLSIKAYGTPLYIKTVPRGAFAPPPAVDSAIVSISGISRDNFKNKGHEEQFFALVRKGFSSKRKKLSSNLGVAAGVFGDERAEDLNLKQWLILSE